MTKKQREYIKYQLDSNQRQMDKMEKKSEKAESAGDFERAKKYEHMADLRLYSIEAAIGVLNVLGYSVRYDRDSDGYLILDN